ncbi:hypothetical protein Godav_023442 [Gossypium davidsonii]|uniref:Uncharacterized protein n=1 Tax=Gossypium davidsonii TaxID=34287 RepID=A0A7J8SS92_GOSDV|nr:hypothetical protein [Gossypium davidsonii]
MRRSPSESAPPPLIRLVLYGILRGRRWIPSLSPTIRRFMILPGAASVFLLPSLLMGPLGFSTCATRSTPLSFMKVRSPILRLYGWGGTSRTRDIWLL